MSTFSRFLFYLICWNFLILSDNLWPLFPSWTSWSVFSSSSWSFQLFLDVVVVQLLSHVWFFVTPWTEGHWSPLSSTVSCNLLKSMSIESVMPSNHLIFCHPFLFMLQILPSIRVFFNDQTFTLGSQKIGALVISAAVLPMNIQGWFPLGWTLLQLHEM